MEKFSKLEDWEANLQDICGSYNAIAPKNRRHVKGLVSCFVKNGLEVAQVNCDLDYVKRSKLDVSKDKHHQFFLLEQKQGQCRISQRNVDVYLNQGDFALMDSAYPVSMYYDGAFSSQISHHLPAQAMLSLRNANSTNLHLAGNNPKAQILRGYLDNIFNDDRDSWVDNEKKMALQNLVTLSFIDEKQPIHANEKLYKNALFYIQNNFTNPELGPTLIADELGISLRQVQKSFQKYGQTISGVICEIRLKYAAEILGAYTHQTKKTSISNLAFDSGFGDLSYFNRRFKLHFGCCPTDYK